MSLHFINKKKNRVLIIVAHPDDEVLGCGGTIAKHIYNGDKVFCIYLADGITARNFNTNKTLIQRKQSLIKVEKFLGFKWIRKFCGKFRDQRLDAVNLLDIIKIIEEAKKEVNPDIIYTHSQSDLNIDHRLVAEASLVAFRPTASQSFKAILSFEIPSATDYGGNIIKRNFNPNFIVNIKKFWKIKKKAINLYKHEILKFPNSRSLKGIEALHITRGVQNGIEIAEAFEVIKLVDR